MKKSGEESDVLERFQQLTRDQRKEGGGGISISIGSIGSVVINNYGKRRRRERRAGVKTDGSGSADGPGSYVANHVAELLKCLVCRKLIAATAPGR